MKYPKEWPGFLWHGEVREGVNFLEWFGIEMRDPSKPKRDVMCSWPWSIAGDLNNAKPLTQAAREMLALAREGVE